MKISNAHYEFMHDAMKSLASSIPVRREAIITEGKASDIEKRLRWDLMYAAGLSGWICTNLYPYCDDDHIDTALRSILKEIEKRL